MSFVKHIRRIIFLQKQPFSRCVFNPIKDITQHWFLIRKDFHIHGPPKRPNNHMSNHKDPPYRLSYLNLERIKNYPREPKFCPGGLQQLQNTTLQHSKSVSHHKCMYLYIFKKKIGT
jgi:hypothetical protein